MKHPAITACHDIVEKRLEQLFIDRNPVSLFEPMAYPVKAGGKRIRPVLLCLSCQAVGGDLSASIPAAMAVELLHTFTLVHDDIMDQDDTRRGIPTVHKKWDEATAILAGDGLVTLAYETLLSTSHSSVVEIAKLFTDGLLVLCEGQALDKSFEDRMDVSLNEYQDMIAKKTAKLLEVSCQIGGMIGDGNPEELESLKAFACNLGMAFQIQDDLLDVIGDQNLIGKPTGSDLMQKKKTYQVIHFMDQADEEDTTLFLKEWEKSEAADMDISAMIQLLQKNGSIDKSRDEITKYIQNAENALDSLKQSGAVEAMQLLNQHLMNRIS